MNDDLTVVPDVAGDWRAKYERMQNLACAGRWLRFATFLIDYLFYVVCYFFFVMLVFLVFGAQVIAFFHGVSGYLAPICIFLFYYAFFEGVWARTPGKFCVGTRVVNEVGERASFGQNLGRSILRFVPFDAFSFFLELGWHDRGSNTRVIMHRPSTQHDQELDTAIETA